MAIILTEWWSTIPVSEADKVLTGFTSHYTITITTNNSNNKHTNNQDLIYKRLLRSFKQDIYFYIQS